MKGLVDKSVRKIDGGKISNKFSKYAGWRELLETEILGCGVDDEKVQQSLDDMNLLRMEEMEQGNLPKGLKEVDNGVYRAVQKSAQAADDMEEAWNRIKGNVKHGHGRHAVRVLDEHFQFDFGMLTGGRAADAIFLATAKNMQELGPYASAFRVRLNEPIAAKTPIHLLYGLQFIKRVTRQIQDLNFRPA